MKHFVYILVATLVAWPIVSHAQLDVFTPLFQQNTSTTRNDFPLDLVWKAHTNTPAFYEGKPLPTNGSLVSVVALTPTQNTGTLTFFWETDGVSLGSQGTELEGRGEDVFTFITNPVILRPRHTVSVTAQNLATGHVSSATVVIPVQDTEVKAYLMSRDTGIFSQHIDRLNVAPGSTLTLLAAPFYFAEPTSELVFSWTFGRKPVFNTGSPALLDVFINPASGRGSQDARVDVRGSRSQASTHTTITVSP